MDLDNAPSVSLGGKKWPIPLLAAKQNKIIDPLILSLLPVFAQWNADRATALALLSADKYNDLLTIAFIAVKRAQTDLKRDEFEDLSITLPELIAAFPIIAQQTGVFAKAEGRESLGEAKNPSSPIGTE